MNRPQGKVDSITHKKVPSPSEFLKQAVGRKVTVKLNNNTKYTGIPYIY
jgi:hypothetical protein